MADIKLYGITIVDSEGNWMQSSDRDGVIFWTESYTKVFTNKKACIQHAVEKAKECFQSYEFDDNKDWNSRTLREIQKELRKGNNDTIQGSDSHFEFDFFEQTITA